MQHNISELSEALMVRKMNEHINGILRENLYEMHLTMEQLQRLSRQKQELRDNLKRCGIGDRNAKEFMIDFIEECMLKLFSLNEKNIDETYFFCREGEADPVYQFDRLLFYYGKTHGSYGMERMIEDHRLLDNGKNEVTAAEISRIYYQLHPGMSFAEKLQLLSYKVYAAYKGLGVIDELRDMHIDGVSGGVSGRQGQWDSVWMFYKGRSIHLSFLSFGNAEELERVCRNICRFQQPGELSKSRGYLVHEMADHARIVVARPDFAENWMFFVRKLDQCEKRSLEELYPTEDAKSLIELLGWIMKGCMVVGITGMQGSGKTTLLMALIEHLPCEYTIRVLELAFELHLRELYPKRNVVTFRETETVPGWEGLQVQRKTDGMVTVIGELVSHQVAAWMIESGQTGSLATFFTHHARSTRSLVHSLRNSLLKEGSFQSERIALQQVLEVVRFDIHLHMSRSGERYIERVTQIVEDASAKDGFLTIDLVEYENGSYIQKNKLDEATRAEMARWLTPEEKEAFFAADI